MANSARISSSSRRKGACYREFRKRSRCTMQLAVVVATMTTIMYNPTPTSSFSLLNTNLKRARSLVLGAAGSSTAMETPDVKAIKPKLSSSKEKRDNAVKAMKRTQVESALDGVDAQLLELLSDHFLYPSASESSSRPRGRPDFVPGAMRLDTYARFREHEALTQLQVADFTARISDAELEIVKQKLPEGAVIDKPATRRGRKRKVKGETVAEDTTKPKPRKRIVKNLPDPKKRTAPNSSLSKTARRTRKKNGQKINNLEFQKYYQTELLTAEEEYELGLKIQLMVKCEEVHEGLAAANMGLPTIKEWAGACGYAAEDPDFVEIEGMAQIRPAGSDSMFEETDPNLFVGNGLAHLAGPGRGRGRGKKPPPTKLGDFYDPKLGTKRSGAQPVNRGTAEDFVDMMMDAREAKQHMVQSNMRLVVSIARKYSNVGVGLEDLVQEGSLGLSRAAEKYDPSKGFKFSTYASWWIQQAVFRSIAYHSRTIRLPVHIHNLLSKLRKVRGRLNRDLGRQPTNEEMATALDLTLSKYNRMIRLTRQSISLDMAKYQSNPKDLGHESEDLLGETISSAGPTAEDEISAEKRVDRSLFHADLDEMLDMLDDDEREVIRYRYGLVDGLTRTVTAVAVQLKQSKAWVRSQECKALRKLRRPWYEKKLLEHQEALTG